MKTGIQLIADERERQISQEGWSLEDDDRQDSGQLNDAALAYAYAASEQSRGENLRYIQGLDEACELPQPWPWESSWWKPSDDQVRNLVKAGALIAAEIDRLQRVTKLPPMPGYNGDERSFR